MKQRKLLMITLGMLFPLLLSAQNPFLKLKPGDWFKVQVNINSREGQTIGAGSSVEDLMTSEQGKSQYDIRFVLNKQLANGHELYNATLERLKFKRYFADKWYGYDSYYPAYLQGNSDTLSRITLGVEIDAQGKVIKIDDHKKPYPQIMITEISPKKVISNMSSQSYESLPPPFLNSLFNIIATTIKKGNMQALSGKPISGLKDVVSNKAIESDISILPVAASFPVRKNVLITGKILHHLTGNNKPEIYTDFGTIKINADGTFKTEILLTEPTAVLFIYGQNPLNTIKPLVKPGDTLTITADALEPQDAETVKKLVRGPYFSGPFLETVTYSGSGAADAAAQKPLYQLYMQQGNQFPDMMAASKSMDSFIAFQEKGKKDFDALINTLKGKVSKTAIDYYTNEWIYLQAEARLYVLYHNNYLYTPQSAASFEGFPANYFSDIDNLPVLMNDYPNSDWYKTCFNWLVLYRSAKLKLINGGQNGFLTDYSACLASFKGYALYLALSKQLDQELHASHFKDLAKLKPYYLDFINNCGDTTLTKPIIEKWNTLAAWEPGKSSPLNITFKNGQKLDLEKFKGKQVCVIINYTSPDDLKQYEPFIKKQDPEKVQFVIIQLASRGYGAMTIDGSFLKKPNISYNEVDGSPLNMKGVEIYGGESSVYFFDKWLRVVDDIPNIGSNLFMNNETNKSEIDYERLDKALQKATAVTRYSKDQKTKFYTTLGWGASSILLAFIAGYLIYRNRVAKIKRELNVKQRIKELEIKAIRSQMNPHFIFNALNSIQSLINSKLYKEANIYLEKFALMMRKVLNNSEKSMVALSEELDAVTLYCQLEQLRFDFDLNMQIAPGLNTELIEIPGMIIQPLVENAIIHGLAQKGAEGKLEINIFTTDNNLSVIVSDNGPGFNGNPVNPNSFGLKLVNERLSILQADGHKAQLILANQDNGTGAIVTLTLPIN
ncbi:Histidine kinase [Mucilaginibacter pineti]|uniref:Histidine kinase n=1 Tax=Mucilaginibacter pineti TaxID=1391627 RepID=A0A1G7AUQ2_9SPHI|nr:histidine kinase [Mucilaginibacter pineti]SDE18569.1 Histidine kinase [Mucilaginibacter pineti]